MFYLGEDLFEELARDNDLDRLRQLLVTHQNVDDNTTESKNTALHAAAQKGYTDIALVLINAGADIRQPNWKGLTPAHLAAKNGQLDVLRMFLSCEKSLLNMKDLIGNTLLNTAASKGHAELVQFLLQEDADYTIRNKHGNTLFHSAAQFNRLKVLQTLLESIPEGIDDINNEGNTALHIAAERSYTSIIELLLAHGARPMKKNAKNKIPYQMANAEARKVFRKFETFKEIVSKCVNGMASLLIKKRYEDDNTALHVAASFDTLYDAVGNLLQAGADANAQNCYNQTPLIIAVEGENTRIAKKLISAGARADDIESRRGQSAIHIASYNNNIEMMKLLTRRNGVNINIIDNDGKTALAYAIVKNSRNLVQHLLKLGADTSMKDQHGLNALHLSVLTKNTEITEDILQASNQNLVNEKNVSGKSPLLLAIGDRRSPTFDNTTIKMIDILLDKGADPHLQNSDGKSAWSLANEKGFDLVARVKR